MSDTKKFQAGFNSDASQAPVRVAFLTRRSSVAVRTEVEPEMLTYPEVFFRIAVAFELLLLALVGVSLAWNAPLELIADPLHTPDPAKAPWYFLGLQELLHYFPPVVAGVLVPGLVIAALIVVPYIRANTRVEPLWARDRDHRLVLFAAGVAVLSITLAVFKAYPVLVVTLVIAGLMFYGAGNWEGTSSKRQIWLASKSLSFWIMTWFLAQLVVLTVIGTYFRGPEWSWVWPWKG